MTLGPGPDVLEYISESKNLPLDELSTNTNAMSTTLLPEASKDDEKHEGIRILARKDQSCSLASFDNTLPELLVDQRYCLIDENLEARLADEEISLFDDMPDLIPVCDLIGTNTPVRLPEGHQKSNNFAGKLGSGRWLRTPCTHSLFHRYGGLVLTNCQVPFRRNRPDRPIPDEIA
jgi:hypothetical protein